MSIGDEEAVRVAEKKFDLKELMANLGKLKRRENDGKNKRLEENFPVRFVAEHVAGGKNVDVQLISEMGAESGTPAGKGEKLTVQDARGLDVEVDVVARVWLTKATSDKEGKGSAVCYNLDKSGNWWRQEAGKYVHKDTEATNIWNVGKAIKVSDVAQETDIKTLLESVKDNVGLNPKMKRQQTSVTVNLPVGANVNVVVN